VLGGEGITPSGNVIKELRIVANILFILPKLRSTVITMKSLCTTFKGPLHDLATEGVRLAGKGQQV
jgi:hypothetical protein